jgi:hypothetical protein
MLGIERKACSDGRWVVSLLRRLALQHPGRITKLISLSTDPGGADADFASAKVWSQLIDMSGTPHEQARHTLSWLSIRVRSPISLIAFSSLGEEFGADLPSTRPGFPAFANRLGVAVHVDLFQLFYAVFYCFSRAFIFFPG